ncbi:MAG: UDP-N-acetylmuramoyl-L-alanine--D-glutamate ligase [Candidatus Dojkabacteria bacterium]|jgi:UDP-N-acetylmuramoylalanine--D-glutamate ligase|nr:UDP-N-acetylmuramoyl-L-alanine--D-glutamate ligase [Candidatus Dojkabacteria bacterium]
MYQNKKVLIFGLGLNDGGLGMTQYFLREGAQVTITDGKSKEELKISLQKLSQYPNITYHLGGHIESDFTDNDIIVRNPAIKPNNQYLEMAREAGKEIVMEMSLFHKIAPCSVIGVTGTRGKSTTTSLIYEILKSVYGSKAILGGNIGKSAIRQLPTLSKENLAVLELSSFQLDSMGEAKVSPHIAVITNIYQDHMDWHGSLEEYINAKKNIFLNQSKEDFLVLNLDDENSRGFENDAKGKVITYSLKNSEANYYMDENLNVYENQEKILRLENTILEGLHNDYNMICSIATTRILAIEPEMIKSVLENFKGLECRQEFVRELEGVKYYNDTCATSVEAINAMFERFGEENKGKIIMIAGGVDKGLDYSKILDNMEKYLKALVLFEGTASEEISRVSNPYIKTYKYFNSMNGAIDKAKEISTPNDMIILCPGGSSFNMFINEFDRGKKFVDYVNSL